ncbi:BCAS2-domain-containing protein [Rhizoclosmatium globosum]|uniref:BCAS2-domain-containing protein n=1 Tax=Rhizoclosmatium globosum TaxID=329046 RepID=A0A1Y2CHF7_9FUNG|nr:BCAS2-domain-containing protein [Rhizoclosmatium globosum]|eukprot:ORY46478.1 BCAS2-domain-containing protein [Rhizoclosmatium globosum]
MALPYVDKEYESEAAKAYVSSLIASELQAMGPNRRALPGTDISLFSNAPNSRRFSKQQHRGGSIGGIDTTRFRLEPPSHAQTASEDQWAAAVANAHAQLEVQLARIATLELVSAFGANQWKIANFQLESMVARVRAEADAVKAELLALNKDRKTDQLRAGAELARLDEKWNDLVDRVLRAGG